MGVMRPELVMKSIVPVVMAGVLGIYGLIVSVIIATNIHPTGYTLFQGYAHLGSGLTTGLAGLAAGMAIGIIGDAGVRANAQQPKLFTGMLLMLIFAEALALYGLIVGIILSSAGSSAGARSARGAASPPFFFFFLEPTATFTLGTAPSFFFAAALAALTRSLARWSMSSASSAARASSRPPILA